MDQELYYTREASPPVILSSFFHFLILAAGAGSRTIQEVECSSGCDQSSVEHCNVLVENQHSLRKSSVQPDVGFVQLCDKRGFNGLTVGEVLALLATKRH